MNNITFNATKGSANLTNLELVRLQSLAVLAIVNQGPAQLFVFSGIVGLLASSAIITTIAFGKKLRTKSYVLVACLAFSDALMACCLIALGARRMWAFYKSVPMAVSRFQCLWEDAPRAFATGCINGFFCTCALDRFLAVATPHWYRTVYPKWLFVLIIALNYLRAGMETGVLFWGIDAQQMIPMCSYPMAADLDVQNAEMIRNKILYVAICVLFVATMVITFYRLRRVKRQGGNVQSNRTQMQTKVLWTLAMMLVCYFISVITNTTGFMFIYDAPPAVQVKYGAFSFTFQEACALCNFLILIIQNNDFRNEFLNLVRSGFVPKPTQKSTGLSSFFVKVFTDGLKESSVNVPLSKVKTVQVVNQETAKY